jgi:hypothetical protein
MAGLLALGLCLGAGCIERAPPAESATQIIDNSIKPEDRLIRALEKEDLKAVEQALASGSDPNSPGTEKMIPLELAARKGFVDGGRALLNHEKHRAEVDRISVVQEPGPEGKVVERRGNAALHTAVAYGQVEFAKLLIEHKADVNLRNGRDATPLDMAKGIEERLRALELGESGQELSPEQLASISDRLGKITAMIALLEQHGGQTSLDVETKKLDEINSGGIIGSLPEEIRHKSTPRIRDRNESRARDEKKPRDGAKPSGSEKPVRPKVPPLEEP